MSSDTSSRVDNRPKINIIRRILFILNTLVHMGIAIVVYIIWRFLLTTPKISDPIKYHILFSFTGYQLFLLEGIISFVPSNSWSFGLRKERIKWIHMIIQILGSIFVFIGFIFAITAKSQSGKPHFKSTHGICGLVGFIVTLVGLANGLIAFWGPKWKEQLRPTIVKFSHVLSGCTAIIMGMVTLCLGLKKGYVNEHVSDGEVTATITFTVLSVIFTLMHPILSIKGYLANMKSTVL